MIYLSAILSSSWTPLCVSKQYKKPVSGICFLHAQVETIIDDAGEPVTKVDLPPFLDVDRKLEGSDDDKKYGAYGLSLIGK